jgi:hypothetical protein
VPKRKDSDEHEQRTTSRSRTARIRRRFAADVQAREEIEAACMTLSPIDWTILHELYIQHRAAASAANPHREPL